MTTPPNLPDLAAVVARVRQMIAQSLALFGTPVTHQVELFDDLEALCAAAERAGEFEAAYRSSIRLALESDTKSQSDLAALRAARDQWHSTASRLHDEATELGSVIDGLRAENERLKAERDALALVDRISDSEMMALLKRVNREFELRVKAAEDAQLNLVKMCESKQEILDVLRERLAAAEARVRLDCSGCGGTGMLPCGPYGADGFERCHLCAPEEPARTTQPEKRDEAE